MGEHRERRGHLDVVVAYSCHVFHIVRIRRVAVEEVGHSAAVRVRGGPRLRIQADGVVFVFEWARLEGHRRGPALGRRESFLFVFSPLRGRRGTEPQEYDSQSSGRHIFRPVS